MSSCVNCGNHFVTIKGKKGSRRSLQAKLDSIERTAKDVLETEFGLVLTPTQKETRFLCGKCSWNLAAIAKSSKTKTKAASTFTESASSSSYISEKIRSVSYMCKKGRSPAVTPRKTKRPRLFSPEKPTSAYALGKQTWSDVTEPQGALRSKQSLKFKISSQQADINRALKYINGRFYKRGISLLMKLRVGFKNAIIECVREQIRNEVTAYSKKKDCILHGKQTLQEISKFDWATVFGEITENCPALTNMLTGSLTSKMSSKCLGLSSNPKVSLKPALGTIVSIIMYMRKPRIMCNLQEMNSLLMWLSSTKREMFARFNHLGLCVGIAATKTSIDRIRKDYNTEVLHWKSAAEEYIAGLSNTEETIPYGSSAEVSEDIVDSLSESSMAAEPVSETSMAVEANGDQDSRQVSEGTSDPDSVTVSEHEGKFGYSLCFDNVNTKVTVRHHAKDRKNKMFNMVQGFAAKDRIATLHLSDTQPPPEVIKDLPVDIYFPTQMDEITLRSETTVMITRVLCKYLNVFRGLDVDLQHIKHRYSKQSAKKSEMMVPLGVIDKDESKVADTIDIMSEYHKYVPAKTNGHPLTIPLHADGLSCERGNDAQSARINATDPWQQLQGLHLNVQEWHKRCTLLQDIYDDLYSSGGRDKGTMYQLKNYFNHRSVTNNVKESFNYNEEFLDFCGDGYLVLAAMHFMDITELDGIPEEIANDIDSKVRYLNNITTKIVDMVFLSVMPLVDRIITAQEVEEEEVDYQYCICQRDIGGPMIFCENRNCVRGTWFHLQCLNMTEDDVPEDKWFCCADCKREAAKKKTRRGRRRTLNSLLDGKKNYVISLMISALNQKVRRDAIRENDGNRIIMHWRYDMLQFVEKHHPKYFLLGQRLLSSVGGAVSPRLQQALTWNRTVNPKGGTGKNIAIDLQMEHFNKDYKESVKDAAGMLTEATIARHSQMIGVGKELRKVYEKQVSGLSGRTVHKSTEVNREKDIAEFVSYLRGEDFFSTKPGRCFSSYPDMDLNLYPSVVPSKVRARLLRLTKAMSKRQQLIISMQEN